MSELRIFTAAWGAYVDIFEKAVATSLGWPRNREAIKNAVWNIVTSPQDAERVRKIAMNCGVSEVNVYSKQRHPSEEHNLFLYLQDEMQICVAKGATYLFALPDYVFGDGTVPNMISCITKPYLCIAVPNTRVLPSAMEEFKRPLTNQELLNVAFDKRYMHSTWAEAELGKDTINSFKGGVSWKEIEPGVIIVTHRLPSSYLCQFKQSDVDWFKSQISFSVWDHLWPQMLIQEGRQRFVGSSDVAFITEITEADKNLAENTTYEKNHPDKFHRNLLHNRLNAGVVSVFRK